MPNKITSLKVSTKKATQEELDKIPVCKVFNYEDLIKDNDDKIEVIAEIPVSTSKRDWDYTEEALKDVVKDVNEGVVVGFKGHQKPENISTEFPDVKTFWLGAVYDEKGKKAIVRGLQDKHDTQLNYLVKNGIINTVSIFGQPKLEKKNGRTKVTGYKTMSIDWTPRNRAGMPTIVKVASGEMEVLNDSFSGELDGSFEDTSNALMTAVRDYFGVSDQNEKYAWSRKTYPDYAIVDVESNNKRTLYKVNYEEKDDKINITSSEEVKLVESYVSISGEQSNEGGQEDMNNNNSSNNNNQNTKPILPDEFKNVLGEMSAEDLKNILTDYNKLKENEAKRIHGEMVAKCVDSKIQNEKVKKLVMELASFKGETEEAINGEIDIMLKKEVVKSMLNTEYKGVNETNISQNNNDGKIKFAGLKRA